MFNLITIQGLTPNQFYTLCCIKESISPSLIHLNQELIRLEIDKWVAKDTDYFKLTPKADQLVSQIASYFKVQNKKTTIQVMGTDYGNKIEEYLLTFPKIKLPSGKAARTDKKNVEVAFKWFFENYNYSWETILQAVFNYVTDYETRSYKYMQTSQYFIRKQNSDKTWASELANWCATVESGEMTEDQSFKEKVV